jgi:hypothetical protein
MEKILMSLDKNWIPSKSRRVRYLVTVAPGRNVTLEHSKRKRSDLPWERIERVYKAALDGMVITTKNVDELLGDHPAGRNASTMCALVLAMIAKKTKVGVHWLGKEQL